MSKADQIKLVAQFLFDNADEIVAELSKTDNYRNLAVEIDAFKHDETIRITTKVYDAKSGHQYLAEDHATTDELRIACRAMNVKAGLIVVEDESVVRDSLQESEVSE